MKQQSYSWENFGQSLTSGVREKIEGLMLPGLSLCLVGGASRQWLSTKTLPLDLDFEIRVEVSDGPAVLIKKISKLLSQHFGDIQIYPFGVFKAEMLDMGHLFRLEFSLPRQEIYLNKSADHGFGHSDFEVKIDPQLTCEQSFLRRDFSINAIGLELKRSDSEISVKLQDPFHGLDDLEAKILRSLSEQFFFDPVRLLRTIRFQLSLGFTLAPSLKNNLKKFNLQKMTVHYFLSEAFKTDFFAFIRVFFQYAEEIKWPLPAFLDSIKKLTTLAPEKCFRATNVFELAIIIAECSGAEKIDESTLENTLGLKNKTIQKLILAKKSEEVILKLQQLDSSLHQTLSELEFFHHPLVRDLALVIKAYGRYPEVFEQRWTYLKKTGHELEIVHKLSRTMADIEVSFSVEDEGPQRDLRKMILAMRTLKFFPRIAGI